MARKRPIKDLPQFSKGQPFTPQKLPRPVTQGFTPYVTPPLPTGTYDPALDAQRASAGRGLLDLTQDTETAGTRATVDYGLQREDVLRQLGYSDQDIATQRQQATEDFGTQRSALQRAVAQQASSSGQQINAAGVGAGGALLQARAKRAAAEAIQAGAINTAQQRSTLALDTQGERTHTAADTQLGTLGLGYQRGVTDRATALQRAGREDLQFGVDTEGEKQYQAAGAGYVPSSSMPKNETVDAYGVHTQTHVVNGVKYTTDQNGHVVSQERVSAPVHPDGAAAGLVAAAVPAGRRIGGQVGNAAAAALVAPKVGMLAGQAIRRRRR